jgi:hypothetical protein
MQYKARFLNYKPSHQSATAILLAANLFASKACVAIGLARKPIESLELLKFMSDGELGYSHALSMWTSSALSERSKGESLSFQELTQISAD